MLWLSLKCRCRVGIAQQGLSTIWLMCYELNVVAYSRRIATSETSIVLLSSHWMEASKLTRFFSSPENPSSVRGNVKNSKPISYFRIKGIRILSQHLELRYQVITACTDRWNFCSVSGQHFAERCGDCYVSPCWAISHTAPKDWLVRFFRKLGRGWSPGNCLPSLVI